MMHDLENSSLSFDRSGMPSMRAPGKVQCHKERSRALTRN